MGKSMIGQSNPANDSSSATSSATSSRKRKAEESASAVNDFTRSVRRSTRLNGGGKMDDAGFEKEERKMKKQAVKKKTTAKKTTAKKTTAKKTTAKKTTAKTTTKKTTTKKTTTKKTTTKKTTTKKTTTKKTTTKKTTTKKTTTKKTTPTTPTPTPTSSLPSPLPRTLETRILSTPPTLYCIGVDEAGRGPLAGPLVCAAFTCPPNHKPIQGVTDSKQLTSEDDREAVFDSITSCPDVKFCVAVIDRQTIDSLNILQATMLGMRMACNCLISDSGGGRVPSVGIEGCYTYYVNNEKGGKKGKKEGGKDKKNTDKEKEEKEEDDTWYALVDGNRYPSIRDTDTDSVKETPSILCPGSFVIKGDGKEYCIAAASVLAKVTRDRIMREYDEMYPEYGLGKHKGYGTKMHCEAIYKHGVLDIHRRTFAPVRNMEGVEP